MPLRLHYVFPNGAVIDTKMTTATPFLDAWVQTNAEMKPDVIFFFTVDSTDIFSD